MPPLDKQPESVVRYLTRILAALTLQAGGELRIPQKFINLIASEDNRQALLEDTNIETSELVLRFGSKHSAVYPVEPDLCASPKSQSTTTPFSQPGTVQQPSSRPPLTFQQLDRMEKRIQQAKAAAILRNEQRQQNSSNPSELNFPV